MLSRQVVFVEPGRVELQEVKISEELQPHEALVRAAHSIVSPGTEGAGFTGVAAQMPHMGRHYVYPFRPGYGHLGVVLAVGEAVTMCKPGDVVLSFSAHASLVKANAASVPLETPIGGRPSMALPVPDGLRTADAAFARMAGVSIAAVRASSVQPGDTVLVIGLGLVGNLAAQLFRLAGAEVMASEISPFRRKIATRCGIDRVVGADELAAALYEWTGGRGARIVVEATGLSRLAETAVTCCARHGEVILLGSPRAPVMMDVTPMLARIHLQAIRMIGALEWTWPLFETERGRGSVIENHRQLLQYIHDGRLKVAPLLTDLASPRDCQRVYEELVGHKDEHLAAVFDWTLV